MYLLWILLGCVGGVLLFLVIIFALCTYKKSRRKKKRDVEHFDDVENGNAPKRRRIKNTILDFTEEPKGLPNVGDTCYMNSMIQCLAWSPCLRSQLEDQIRKQKVSCGGNSVARSLLAVLEAYHEDDDDETNDDDCPCCYYYPDRRKSSRNHLITFLDAIYRRNGQFGSREQEDTFEFFNVLISTLQEEALENIPRSDGDDTYDEHVVRHCGASRLFFGKFITSYCYQQCGHVEVVPQSFTSLSVPAVTNSDFESNSKVMFEVDDNDRTRLVSVTSHNGSSIIQGPPQNVQIQMPDDGDSEDPDFGILGARTNNIDVKPLSPIGDKLVEMSLDKRQGSRDSEETGVEMGLGNMTETETMMASEVSCRICERDGKDGATGVVYKKLQIISLPPVLVLQINRFKQRGRELYKVIERVTFPKSLDMARFCSVAMKQVSGADGKLTPGESYSLFGVVNHQGSITGGHYFAYIKTSQRNANIIQNQLHHQWYDPERITSSIRTELEKIWHAVKDEDSSKDTQSSVHSREGKQFPVDHQPEMWFSVSDSCVKKIDEDTVMQSAEAYILMYERK